MDQPAVVLSGVSTVYQGEELPSIRDINLEIDEGEFNVILGPNGVGKTTLLETINGLLPHNEGEVYVFGSYVGRDGHQVRKEIGYLPQEISFSTLTPFLVRDVVAMGRYGKIGLVRRLSTSDWDRVHSALEKVGMASYSDRPIGKLSGGQQQKVLLARMLAKQPRILLLDEPFSNLDFVALSDITNLLSRLHEQSSLTTSMVLHNTSDIPSVCNRVILMSQGSIARTGSPDTLLDSEVLNSVF